jgi:hypothetical protein
MTIVVGLCCRDANGAVTAVQLEPKDLLAIMPEAFPSLQFLEGHQVLLAFVPHNCRQWKNVVDSM